MGYRAGVALACALLGTGCYRYIPTTFDALSSEMTVRASVAGEAYLALSEVLGRAPSTIEGEVVGRDAEGVLVAIPQRRSAHGDASTRIRQHVRLQEADVLRVDVRSLDRRRTGLWLGVAAGAVAYLLYRTVGPSAGSDREPPPTNAPNRIVPPTPIVR